MRIEIAYVEVDRPIFLKDTQLGTRFGIFGTRKFDVGMVYDTELMCLILTYRGKATLVPFGGIKQMEARNPEDIGLDANAFEKIEKTFAPKKSPANTQHPNPHLPPAAVAAMAQVETPSAPLKGRGAKSA